MKFLHRAFPFHLRAATPRLAFLLPVSRGTLKG